VSTARVASSTSGPVIRTPSCARRPVQAALDKVALGLMDDHAHHCVVGGPDSKKEERTEELMAAVGRLMRRG